MVQKYSGRGLKTITICAPGIRPQKFRICVGNHPDDIREWIEERRRRFPRRGGGGVGGGKGEVAAGGEGGVMAGPTSTDATSVGPTGRKRGRRDVEEGGMGDSGDGGDDRTMRTRRGVGDDANCGNGNGNASYDDDGWRERTGTGGLSSLLAGYDSSSSSAPEDEATESVGASAAMEVATTTKTSTDLVTANDAAIVTPPVPSPMSVARRVTVVCRHHRRGRCRHGISCRFVHSDEPVVSGVISGGITNDRQHQRNGPSRQGERDRERNRREDELRMLGLAAPRNRGAGGKSIDGTSLLHKLLRRDKERERRLTLQLLRYIVDCDYFRDEDTSAASLEGEGAIIVPKDDVISTSK
jgi:hypothetical protein